MNTNLYIEALPPMLGLEDEMILLNERFLTPHYTALIGKKRVFVFVDFNKTISWYITIGPSHATDARQFDFNAGNMSRGWYVEPDPVALLSTLHAIAAVKHPKARR